MSRVIWEQYKIFNSIIKRIFVNVMDDFFFFKKTLKMFFHYQHLFWNKFKTICFRMVRYKNKFISISAYSKRQFRFVQSTCSRFFPKQSNSFISFCSKSFIPRSSTKIIFIANKVRSFNSFSSCFTNHRAMDRTKSFCFPIWNSFRRFFDNLLSTLNTFFRHHFAPPLLVKCIIFYMLCQVFITYSFAGQLRTPPPVQETGLQDYLFNIRDNFNNLPVMTSNPDGTRPGKVGDIVLFNDSGTYYLEICVDVANKTWVGVLLQDLP